VDGYHLQVLWDEGAERVCRPGRHHEHVPRHSLDRPAADLEAGMAGLDDERLRVRMTVQGGTSLGAASTTKNETSEPYGAPSKRPALPPVVARHDGRDPPGPSLTAILSSSGISLLPFIGFSAAQTPRRFGRSGLRSSRLRLGLEFLLCLALRL
jgi:hypothetical protein